MQLPKARISEILEQEADKELLIYDLRIDKAYNLNETSKIVFKACDGKTSFDDLKRRHKFTDDLIHFALDELKATALIDGEVMNHFGGLSRREVIKKIGLTCAVALPVIAGIAAPSAASAASNPTTCDTACTCSAVNTDTVNSRFCQFQLNATAFGCTTQVIACDCFVAPNSNAGTCVQAIL